MYSEIQQAVNFLTYYLYNNVPRRKVILFAEELANYLVQKYQDEWDALNPTIGVF